MSRRVVILAFVGAALLAWPASMWIRAQYWRFELVHTPPASPRYRSSANYLVPAQKLRDLGGPGRSALVSLCKSAPEEDMALAAWGALDDPAPPAETLREIAADGAFARIRQSAIADLAKLDPPDPYVATALHRELGDEEEFDRLTAAIHLARDYKDAAGAEILVASLRDDAPATDARPIATEYVSNLVVQALAALGERRAVAALIHRRGVAASLSGAKPPGALDAALRSIAGDGPAAGETWEAWWKAHLAAFPPQLDPAAIAAPPVLPKAP